MWVPERGPSCWSPELKPDNRPPVLQDTTVLMTWHLMPLSASPWELSAEHSQVFNLDASQSDLVRFRITLILRRWLHRSRASETIRSFVVLDLENCDSTGIFICSALLIQAWHSS